MDSGKKEERKKEENFSSFLFYDAVIQRAVLSLFSLCISVNTLTAEHKPLKYSETILNRVF